MKNISKLLSPLQYDWLTKHLPEPRAKTGRRPVPNHELLGGILYVLRTGCQWYELPASECTHHYSTAWRRFNFWRKKSALVGTWQDILKLLDAEGAVDLTLGHIDGSLVQSPQFKSGTGYSGKHHRTGTNAVLATEKLGLPLASVTVKGNRQDRIVAVKVVEKIRVGARRRLKKLNADKGFDGAPLRRKLRKKGIVPNIPERIFKKRRKRGRKPLYDKIAGRFRAFVERTIAWLKSFRKLRYRYERKKSMFQAWLDFSCLVVCLRRVRVLQ